ncbi:hypothetical protein GQF04_16115 [Paenibacillus aceris]|uniref:Ig-like domain-containing protein n=1 Tax=Paenibacillus aceris TaxID=869555 RepID=UPI001423E23B|nr:hypothetical protein [Paenibacillus aceris]
MKVADVSSVPTSLSMVSPATATIYGPASSASDNSKITGTNRLQLTASVQPSDAYDKRIMWFSSNPNIAMVDKNGLVIARGTGTVTITGTSMADSSLPPITCTVTVTAAGTDNSGDAALASVLTAAKSISAYTSDTTSSGGFKQISGSPNWEGKQESFQKAFINALGVKGKYAGYSTTNISRDTALFAAIALNEGIRSIDPSKAIVVSLLNKSALIAAINSAAQLTAANFSTQQDWTNLQSALTVAQNINNDGSATQVDIDNATAALQTAMSKQIQAPVSSGSIPTVNMTQGSATIYGSSFVQLQASGSRTWSVTQPDGSITTTGSIDPSGILYATSEGTYKVTAQSSLGVSDSMLITFSQMIPTPNLTVNNNGKGSAFGSTSSGSYPPPNAFDSNPSTFYDHSSTTPYVGWDFGKPVAVNVLRFLPRSGTNAARIYQAKLQGSNTSATSGFVDLYTIMDNPSTANSSSWYVKVINTTTAYRYYRWLGTSTSHANVAEFQLYNNFDKTALGNALDTAQSLVEENYTDLTWEALQTALADAISANAGTFVTQAEIDTAAANLQLAIAGLQVAPGSALEVANGITSIQAPIKDATSLTLPTVPDGFTVAIKNSDHPAVIGLDGTITPSTADSEVQLVLEVTRTSDGTKADTASLPVVVPAKTIVTLPTVTLTGVDSVNSGQSFNLIYGLSGISQNVYAQDITVTYPQEQLDFVSVDSLKEGFTILSKVVTPGQIHLITANIGADHQSNGTWLTLKFNAKSTQSTSASVGVSNVVIADERGTETHLNDASHNVTITLVNKIALSALLADAQSKHDAAVEGTAAGQYPAGAKAELQAVIDNANAVLVNTGATQAEVDQAVNDLSAALQRFTNAILQHAVTDTNGDGKTSIGDLAVVAAAYGKSSTDADWQQFKQADVNGDGEVNIEDLAAVAREILSN